MKNADELDTGDAEKGKRKFYVYELVDDAGKVFYVGKGSGKRVRQHRNAAEKGVKLYVYNKIRSLWNKGEDFDYQIVFETFVEEEAHAEEIRLIAFYGRERLCNLTDGGEGLTGYKMSEKTRVRKSNARKGQVFGEEMATKISAAKLGDRFLSNIDLQEVRRLRDEGNTYGAIALMFSVSLSTIHRRLNPRPLARKNNPGEHRIQPYRKLTEEEVFEIRCQHAGGELLQPIADRYHLSITTVHSIVKGKSWKHVGFPEKSEPRAVRRSNTRLDAQKVAEMRDLFSSGESYSDIARVYEMTVTGAQFVISGRTWKDVPIPDYSKRVKKKLPQRNLAGKENPAALIDEEIVLGMRRMRLGGSSYKDIAEHFNVTQGCARDAVVGKTWRHVPVAEGSDFSGVEIRRKYTKQVNANMAHGEDHVYAKLTEENVITIRKMHMEGGISYKKLGKMFGVSPGVAWDADTGKTWNHVPYPEGHKLA